MLKEEIRRLRKHGYSYSEISKKVDKSKKFVWAVSKDVNFSKIGKKRYHKRVKGILIQIKRQKKRLTIPKIRIIGHLLFDGAVYNKDYNYVAEYINGSKKLIDQFMRDMKKVYGLDPLCLENYPTYYKVYFKSKLLTSDLKNYFESYSTSNQNIRIPSIIMNSKNRIKIEFLRAFFEDEGSISYNGRIMGDLKSRKIIYQLTALLREFGLIFNICKYKEPTGFMYKIYIPKSKENLNRFFKLRLFDKATVSHGKNKGKRKLEVLKETLKIFKKS